MTPDTGYRLKSPPHPGRFIRDEILAPLELNVTAAATALGVTRPALSALLNGRASLSPEMAIRLQKAFGAPMETLLRMQTSHDIAEALKRADEIEVLAYAKKAVAAE